jgi:hypothetical protein
MISYKIINNNELTTLLLKALSSLGKLKVVKDNEIPHILICGIGGASQETGKCLIFVEPDVEFSIRGSHIYVDPRNISGDQAIKLRSNIKYILGVSKQKIIGISYASRQFAARQEQFRVEAEASGYFDEVTMYSENDIASAFKKRHGDVWNQPRGGGYWIWKPYVILKTLRDMRENDILAYIDGGCTLCCTDAAKKRFGEYVTAVNDSSQGVLRMRLTHKEGKYTNKRLFTFCEEYFGKAQEDFAETMQLVGGIMVIRKTEFAMKFFETVMDILEKDDKLITDMYNGPGEQHRHDQSLLSLVYKYMGGNLLIEDETYFPSGRFDDDYAAQFPIWATRLRA